MKPKMFLKSAWGLLVLFACSVFIAPLPVLAQCSPGGINPPTLTALPSSITAGQSISLQWAGPAGGSCTITSSPAVSGLVPSQPASGNLALYPQQNTTFTASCGGPMSGGGCTAVSVTVTAPPTPTPTPTPQSQLVTLTASATSITPGGVVQLSWSGPSGGLCFPTSSPQNYQWTNNLPAIGTRYLNLTETTTFTVNCGGPQQGGG